MCGVFDGHGHFLVCNQLAHVTFPLWTGLEKLTHCLSLEQVANYEIVGDTEAVFAVTWTLAHSTSYIWECKRRNVNTFAATLLEVLRTELQYLTHVEK